MVTQSSEPVWSRVIRLLRWDKPAGRLILMIPALWAVFLGAHSLSPGALPPWPLVGVIVLGTLATSAAGCVVNDLWDRNIDPNVERTKARPLASRALTVKTGVVVLLVSLVCALVLALYLNPLSFILCVLAVPVILLYPLAKRAFPVPQLVLSLAWGFAVLISWSAVTGGLSVAAWLLWEAVVLWTLGFDTVYAMADRKDDIKVGVRSAALYFGPRAADAVGLFYLGTVLLLAAVGIRLDLNLAYWLTLAIAAGGWVWQYRTLRHGPLPPSVYGRIFRQNVYLGFVLLVGMILGATSI